MLVNSDAYQRETLSEWPVWLPLRKRFIHDTHPFANLISKGKVAVKTWFMLMKTYQSSELGKCDFRYKKCKQFSRFTSLHSLKVTMFAVYGGKGDVLFVCLPVASCRDTLPDTVGSWWDQTQTKCSSQAKSLYSKHAGQLIYGNVKREKQAGKDMRWKKRRPWPLPTNQVERFYC